MTVTVFTCDGSALPAAFTINVPKRGLCRDLLLALSSACSLKDDEKILLVEIRNHLINYFLEDPLVPLSFIKDDDHLVAYKISKFVKKFKFLQLIHRREEEYVYLAQHSQLVTWSFFCQGYLVLLNYAYFLFLSYCTSAQLSP